MTFFPFAGPLPVVFQLPIPSRFGHRVSPENVSPRGVVNGPLSFMVLYFSQDKSLFAMPWYDAVNPCKEPALVKGELRQRRKAGRDS